MRIYRTAQGKKIDMAAIIAKNETVRAVGNMKVNARGDTVDGFNNVVTPATHRINEMYAKTVGNKSANTRKPTRVAPSVDQLTEEEKALESEFDNDSEVEQIKQREMKK